MPVVACTRNGKKGYKYGQAGKCYTYEAGDEKGRKRAKQQAYLQGAAIEANTGENELNKYNTCHGPKGRFCSGGSGGGGGGGGGGASAAPAQEEPPKSEAITQEEIQALGEYTGVDYAFVNAYSRFPDSGNKQDKAMYLKKAAVIDGLIAKQPPTKGEEIVYRGMRPPKEVKAQLVKGAILEDKGFMSTSNNREVAKDFGDTIMSIRVPKGSKVLKVQDYISNITTNREHETILPRGTKIEITHVREEKGGFLGMGKKTYIDARVVQ